MSVVAIRESVAEQSKGDVRKGKAVAANQKAIDTLPLDSGTWRVEGVSGLFVRCRAKSKSFYIQRRVHRELVKETIGEVTMKRAKEIAAKSWTAMKPKPAKHDVVTLEIAINRYLEDKQLAESTRTNYKYNAEQYLADWKPRAMRDVGEDRAGFRFLIGQVKKKHGRATSNQVVRLVSAVYRWQRKIDPTLPEPPTTAVEVDHIPARDWAYSSEELQKWWHAREEKKDNEKREGETTTKRLTVWKGVKILGTIKRMWWLTALFTGARKGSIEALKWADLDLQKKTIYFRVTKGDRPYIVPMSDKLAELLEEYHHSDRVSPSEWVFPSNVREGNHIVGVKNDKEGVGPAHRLRHTFRTTLAQLGATQDQARMLMGHSMGGDISRGYITTPHVVESLRPLINTVADHYRKIVSLE
jgi:integrase